MSTHISNVSLTEKDVLAIIKNNPNLFDRGSSTVNANEVNNVIQFLKDFVSTKAKYISTSQIRNLYAKCRAASSDVELQMMRPYITYTLARQLRPKDPNVQDFFSFIDELIQLGVSYNTFQKIFEAIVAYHKYYGQR